jgi:hypothetical protein
MSTEIAVSKPQLTPSVWQMIQEIAPVMKDSRLFGVATTEQAAAVMLKGHELGLSLTASFEFIHVIESKPTLAPRGALALILGSPLCDGVQIVDEVDDKGAPSGCSVTMKRKGGMTYTARFTLADAERAGLTKGGSGWAKYPALMCKWRAIGFAADVVFPDLLNGLKRADELGADLTAGGDVIDGSWTVANGSQPTPAVQPAPPVTVSQTQPVPATPGIDLQTLLSKFSAAEIMSANGGKIPATNFECAIVWEKLEAQELEITGGK